MLSSVDSVASSVDSVVSVVVIMDLMMPGMDGYSVCKAMRVVDRETPIVFLSALDAESDQIRGLDAGTESRATSACLLTECFLRESALTRS